MTQRSEMVMDQPEQNNSSSSNGVVNLACNKTTTLKLHNTQKKLLRRIRELEDELSELKSTIDAPDVDEIIKDRQCSCALCKNGTVQCHCLSCRPQELHSKESAEESSSDEEEKTDDAVEVSVKQDPRFLIVYRVSCSGHPANAGSLEYHRGATRLYLDRPTATMKRDRNPLCLVGEEVIFDLEELLDQRANISMVVYRDFHCLGREGSLYVQLPKWNTEYIQIVQDELYTALELASVGVGRLSAFRRSVSVSSDTRRREMTSPHPFFFHYKSALEEFASDLDEYAQKQIRVLLDYIQTQYADDFEEAKELFSRHRINSHHLPKLFRPDDILVSEGSDLLAYRCNDWLRDRYIKCWSWQFNGSFHKSDSSKYIALPSFLEEIPINWLNIYPLKYAGVGVEKRLRDRGEQFWRCRHRRYVNYRGWDHKRERHVRLKDLFSLTLHAEMLQYDNRFMIDYGTYREMHPDAPTFEDRPKSSTQHTDLDKELEDGSQVLLPANIFGYHMLDKNWIDLLVENISDVVWNKGAFDRLVLKPRTKDMIQALVSVHVSMSGSTDVIDGKGNGLIMLLHGELIAPTISGPGTGKTLTAGVHDQSQLAKSLTDIILESVAELAEKPLYRVTCGDIGTDSDGIEDYLRTVLLIGKIWDCVVLFDEADVFLEERSLADFQRNALVSVFLRVLEYYDGILILTSNRVGHFDEAFKSRIQLSLHYPSLVESDRRKIWRVFIRRLRELPESNVDEAEERFDVDDLEDHLSELASYKLNGRQIRNAVATARQMAKFKKETLEFTHLQTVIEIAKEFDDYLVQAHGQSDEQWAKELGARAG